MSRRIDLLDECKACFFDKAEHKCGLSKNAVAELFNKMLDYYEINDIETGLIHAKIFAELYIAKGEISLDDIAAKFYLHTFTLDRYRQRYNRLAKMLIDKRFK